MLLLTIASIALGGFLMSGFSREQELYVPRAYLNVINSRPRSVYAW